MSGRELIVLGTASQAPSRYRNHNGYLLRFDEEGILFDPGEGTQRQMLLAGVASSTITRIAVTHFHGDHCLGLPGIIQRLSLDRITFPIPLYHPRSGADYLDRLRRASIFDDVTQIEPVPLAGSYAVDDRGPNITVSARQLDHRVESWGYRVEQPRRRHFDRALLASRGVEGPAVGELLRSGAITTPAGRTVLLDEVSEVVAGQSVAFVMDTRPCDAALMLAQDADLLICESTFLEEHRDLAERYGHMTALDAGRLANESGARRLVLTHFSQRITDTQRFVDEAARLHDDVVGAVDLSRIEVPTTRW